jgi:hypothetical protein
MIMVLGPDKKPKPKSEEGAKPALKPQAAMEPSAAQETASEEEILGIVQQEVVPSVSADVTPEEG